MPLNNYGVVSLFNAIQSGLSSAQVTIRENGEETTLISTDLSFSIQDLELHVVANFSHQITEQGAEVISVGMNGTDDTIVTEYNHRVNTTAHISDSVRLGQRINVGSGLTRADTYFVSYGGFTLTYIYRIYNIGMTGLDGLAVLRNDTISSMQPEFSPEVKTYYMDSFVSSSIKISGRTQSAAIITATLNGVDIPQSDIIISSNNNFSITAKNLNVGINNVVITISGQQSSDIYNCIVTREDDLLGQIPSDIIDGQLFGRIWGATTYTNINTGENTNMFTNYRSTEEELENVSNYFSCDIDIGRNTAYKTMVVFYDIKEDEHIPVNMGSTGSIEQSFTVEPVDGTQLYRYYATITIGSEAQ